MQLKKLTFGIIIRLALFAILWVLSVSTAKLIPILLLLGATISDLPRVTELIEIGILMLMVSFGLEILKILLTQYFPALSQLSPARVSVARTSPRNNPES